MHFGLNTTFFDMRKQVERMQRDGVERTILSLATPFIDYHLDAKLAVEAFHLYEEFRPTIPAGVAGWAKRVCLI